MLSFLDPDHIRAFALSVARLGVWLVLLTIVFLPLERLFAVRRRNIIARNLPGDIGFFLISGLVPSLLLTPPLALVGLAVHAYIPAGFHLAVASLPLWFRAVAALFVSEIGFYWATLVARNPPPVALPLGPPRAQGDLFPRQLPRPPDRQRRRAPVRPHSGLHVGLATPLTPAGGAVSALLVLAATMWGFMIHANVKWRLGPLEWLMATPAFHHWHHTLGEPRDRNYASMLPCMDRIFGTYHLPKEFPTSYGTDTEMPASLAGQLLHPFRPPAHSQPAAAKLNPL